MTKKLEITFNKYAYKYELWLHFYDFNEKLYPLQYSHSIELLGNLEVLKCYAKLKYPDIYNEVTILDYSKQNND